MTATNSHSLGPVKRTALALLIAGATLGALASTAARAAEPAMVAETSKGKALVDAKGMTLYVFDKDMGGKSACAGACATNWPPLMAMAGAMKMGEWTVVDREDGSKQWAYKGKPLYTFVKDTKAGEVMGDGVNSVWHVAKP